ncbi:MAG: hypothetical protein HYR97_03740 [Candidatus Melainabacteria bacterium]|nr:hypothetical protein [Candidatus Melainabacteria bacterium]MBI3309151.1 hypothetical protein [Candidatus Melainabacteria bacterium]
MSVPGNITNPKVQAAYQSDLVERYQKLEKAADQTIQSFANLIDELGKLKKESAGTEVKEPLGKITNEVNNSSVYITQMLAEQMKLIHGTLNPEALVSSEESA